MNLEKYFQQFRKNIIGINESYETPYGRQALVYADWIASGRLYKPIEDRISLEIGRFVANTHTESSHTGTLMTRMYQKAHQIIKSHVNAGPDDYIITTGFGMTDAINKFQRILGVKVCSHKSDPKLSKQNLDNRPVVFVTHMEHHSNHTSWYETIADVVIVPPDENMLVNPENLRQEIEKYRDRKVKIGCFTACSNVTGIITPYHQLAKIIHQYGGWCFIDFAASAPYNTIDMHPEDPLERLDAIFFSPHKFLGGPGSSGVLIFNKSCYNRRSPDQPGGGTVKWTNPWGEYSYIEDIETREDGGTPGFLQACKSALAIQLKEKMGINNIMAREHELLALLFPKLQAIPDIRILAEACRERIGCISFYIPGIHHNLIVKLLSDRFGIQVRGGCTCAGTYGHLLLNVDPETSRAITEKIEQGNLSEKPGWVRLSLHPTMTSQECELIIRALTEIRKNAPVWQKDYHYSPSNNEFQHHGRTGENEPLVDQWFRL